MRGKLIVSCGIALLAISGCTTPPVEHAELRAPMPMAPTYFDFPTTLPHKEMVTLHLVSPVRDARCKGAYDPSSSSFALNVPVRCTDGRKGRVLFNRATHAGTVNLSDRTNEYLNFESSGPEEMTAYLYDQKRPVHREPAPVVVVAKAPDAAAASIAKPVVATVASAVSSISTAASDAMPKSLTIFPGPTSSGPSDSSSVRDSALKALANTKASGAIQGNTDPLKK